MTRERKIVKVDGFHGFEKVGSGELSIEVEYDKDGKPINHIKSGVMCRIKYTVDGVEKGNVFLADWTEQQCIDYIVKHEDYMANEWVWQQEDNASKEKKEG